MDNYYEQFINFFKKHNLYSQKIFNYIERKTVLFLYDDKKKSNYGTYPIINKDRILVDFMLLVPYINDYKSLLINIHEYLHAISLYKNIGKIYKKEIDNEILPFLYERIYLQENPNKDLESFIKDLNNSIITNSPIEYKIALEVQQELLNYYNLKKPSFNKLQRKAKKLSKQNISK